MEKTTLNSIKKIAVIGPESTGKTVICQQLAQHYNTVFVPEYARTYFDEHDINNYNTDDLEIIAKKQLELEKEYLPKANNIMICDTSLITIKIWSSHIFNTVPKYIASNIKPNDYDLYLITNNDIPWVADPQRRNEDLREHLFKWNKHELQKMNAEYKIIKGTGDARLQNAITIIDQAFNL